MKGYASAPRTLNLRVGVPLLCEQCLSEPRNAALLTEQWHTFRILHYPHVFWWRCTRQSAIVLVFGLLAVVPGSLLAQDGKPDPSVNRSETLDAPEAVHQGNERLIAGEPQAALESYQQAETLEPDAREIAFVEGLAHFDLKQFDAAREAFRRAAGVENDGLAADALYSLGATDHAEAIASMESDPKQALSLLESGMRRYHDVLTDRPDHETARMANRRAASLWRELKQQLEEQKQQQDQNQDGEHEDEKQQDQQGKDQQEQEDQRNEQQQQEQESQDQSESTDESKEQQQQESQAQKQEQVSREQAERRLREMMQAIRDRKKQRKEQTRKVQIAPVEKDW